MPLVKSKSKAAVGANISAEMAAGKPQKQAVAIALSVQRRAGGGKPKPPKKREPLSSAIHSAMSTHGMETPE